MAGQLDQEELGHAQGEGTTEQHRMQIVPIGHLPKQALPFLMAEGARTFPPPHRLRALQRIALQEEWALAWAVQSRTLPLELCVITSGQRNANGHAEALSTHQDQQQVGRTPATPTQTRMGRAASTPSKKVPRPCPGCFSVIGDPGIGQTGQ
ncbi:hypothetical protein JZ751_000770 [Albula glossodonta]|uniref:Uncharacterized protein n=1 Tax=Albula glossodonta TaxID=121402 RepID=A0A8T2PXI5_9TELE|nr:hypothetical protein JZ751_000770 [Albula glossodonta]